MTQTRNSICRLFVTIMVAFLVFNYSGTTVYAAKTKANRKSVQIILNKLGKKDSVMSSNAIMYYNDIQNTLSFSTMYGFGGYIYSYSFSINTNTCKPKNDYIYCQLYRGNTLDMTKWKTLGSAKSRQKIGDVTAANVSYVKIPYNENRSYYSGSSKKDLNTYPTENIVITKQLTSKALNSWDKLLQKKFGLRLADMGFKSYK